MTVLLCCIKNPSSIIFLNQEKIAVKSGTNVCNYLDLILLSFVITMFTSLSKTFSQTI